MPLIDQIVNVQELATLPEVTKSVLDMLQSNDVDMRTISKIIEKDPVLAFKVLKVINSPLFAIHGKIRSIPQAIMLMGLGKLTNIVLSVSIFSRFWFSKNKDAEAMMEKFWMYSSSTGIVAKEIGKKIHKDEERGIELIGGLLHQIGKIAMFQFNVPQYKKAIDIVVNEKATDNQAERKIYGFSHLDVGEEMAKKWRLGNEIKNVIANYQQPARTTSDRELAASVGFSGVVCAVNGADFYKGISLSNPSDAVQWQVLCEDFPALKAEGPTFITDNIKKHLRESVQYLMTLKSSLSST